MKSGHCRETSFAVAKTSRRLATLLVLCIAAGSSANATSSDADRLQQLIVSPHRTAVNKARDRFRNPLPTLTFLEVRPHAQVVEIQPGTAGYWTEILAPYLKNEGRYIATVPKANPDRPEVMKAIADTKAKFSADPANYDRVATAEFAADGTDLAPPESADFVLTFRNLHNWMAAGKAEPVLAAFHRVLRKGGILGIEEHRGSTGTAQDPLAKSGYVREDYAIALIEHAGFKFVAKSEINSNPNDTKDYTSGVWTLPPTYRLKDLDREKYTAIGESDRFLMKFVKQ